MVSYRGGLINQVLSHRDGLVNQVLSHRGGLIKQGPLSGHISKLNDYYTCMRL